MNQLRTLIVSGLLAALTLGSAAAAPAQAAASGVLIDDSRDGIQCPGAADITDLSTLVPAGNQTFTLCSGEYTGPLTITGKQNLKIVGKADPVLGQPRIIPANGMQGDLLHIQDSTNVSVSGITFDGAARADSGTILWGSGASPSAIHVVNSTATITGNTIVRMAAFSSVVIGGGGAPSGCTHGTGVLVDGATTAQRKVTIASNTITSVVCFGIRVNSDGADILPTITKNLVIGGQGGLNDEVQMIDLEHVQGGSVSGNVLHGAVDDAGRGLLAGINAAQTDGLKISANQIDQVTTGIRLLGDDVSGANNNTVSGNTIVDAPTGVELSATVPAAANLNGGNKITGNKITDHNLLSSGVHGILVSLMNSTGAGNAISGNSVLGYGPLAVAIWVDTPAHAAQSANKAGYPVSGQ